MNEPEKETVIAAARAKRRFPDCEVEAAYPIGWPTYDVRLVLTVLAEDDVATVSRFILRLIGLEPMEPAELGRLLGLSDKFVAGAAAELVEKELAIQRPDRHLEITEQGRQALAAGGRSWSPQRKYPHVSFCPLTRRILDIDTNHLLYPDEAGKNGLFVIPASGNKPRLSELPIEDIREYTRDKEGLKPEEITEVAEIRSRETRLRYRNDITVVKLVAPGRSSPTYVAYRGREYLEEQSLALQRLAEESGMNLTPGEFAESISEPWAQSRTTTRDEENLLAAINDADHAVGKVDEDISATQAEQEEAPDGPEKAELAGRLEQLEIDKAEGAHRLAEAERKLAEQTDGATRLIKTEEHRPLLLEAIDKAQSELTLVSAWIGPDAFDRDLCRKLRQAMARGVQVRIAWGLGTRRGPEADRNRTRGEAALRELKRGVSNDLLSNLTVKRTETHEKFIICDDRFCASGSFNWLSYRGDRGELDRGYRRETSFYSERSGDIALWKANAASLFR